PLGGMGHVTQNMYLYEYGNEILIFDCGIGFPDMYMPGVDILIPDIAYLQRRLEEGAKIVGMVLTHGHDDHIAATPYILPDLPEFPIYASPLTAGFAENRMSEMENPRVVTVLKDKNWVKIGTYFEIMPMAMTHSVPDTKHFVLKTPEGRIYHGTDFKLDKNPVDGVLPDYDAIEQAGKDGIDLMLMDCLRVEKDTWVKSESECGPVIEEAMQNVQGKILVTLMSSHLHRIQQTIDAAVRLNRKIVFVGRSVEQNMEVALSLKKVNVPQGVIIDKKKIETVKDSQLCVIIAGSQGQEGSSLMRAVYGDHPIIRITGRDKVIFSADAIPGNEIPYFAAVDELFNNGIDVVYPTIAPDIHQSGHASAPEQLELLKLVKPKFVMPIGGADRHRILFKQRVAAKAGYQANQVLIPQSGDIIMLNDGKISYPEQIVIRGRAVDGLGVGDVGPRVISDRLALGNAGMIVLALPRDAKTKEFDLRRMDVISRGFVYMKESDEVVKFIKDQASNFLSDINPKMKDNEIRGKLERKISRKLFKVIRREPMVVVAFIDV
ncbi:MAG: ribonuclease J, partial [Candidatus Pacebacteria bacterium]|nr:ribonuclease J [Candidatus Paceibacterota bacterium]